MTQISQKKEKCPKNGYIYKKIKNFHKSKVDSLKKLPCLVYDLMHFKGCPHINHKISCNLSCKLTIFLAFYNLFMILHSLYGGTFKIPSINDAFNPNLKQGVLNTCSIWDNEKMIKKWISWQMVIKILLFSNTIQWQNDNQIDETGTHL